ncbi:glutamine--tRNA ligase [Buchnera aphidicola]|uniref:glutamine--tRNA ligase n=1 Tax=Buchnera aphidicola TaxID=9 RepID=UPI0031B7FDCE
MSKIDFNKNNFIYKIINNYILKNKKKKIITRFPPEPNGHLHLGHIKSICINFEIAKKKNGQCNLRFDDTNPTNEKKIFIFSIINDIKWLGYKIKKNIFFTSKYFKKIYKYAIKLIKKKLAYVDLSNIKIIKKERGNFYKIGKKNIYRKNSIQKNLKLFKKMKNGKFKEGEACLRAKINMKSSCIIMRDPIIYRIKFDYHHQTKKKWCIYPMYDFSHCISDSIEKITHSLCTLEFLENKKLYKWILKKIKVKNKPKQYEFSKLNIENTILSKRKIKKLIKKKKIQDWNDPRIHTISGLRRKGYTAKSLINFCKKSGITKKENILQLSSLESCLKKELNYKIERSMAIINPIKIIITNLPKNYKKILFIPKNPKNNNMGNKYIIFTNTLYIDKYDIYNKKKKKYIIKKKIKLRYSYNIKIYKIKKKKNKNIFFCKYYKKTLGKIFKKIKIIHWISEKNSHLAKFRLYKPLFNLKNPELSKKFLNNINKKSLKIKKGYIESNIYTLKTNFHYQFEREGYFYIDYIKSTKKILNFNRTIKIK